VNLSPHFTLEELAFTRQRDVDNTPPVEAVAYLRRLATSMLEPIRQEFGVVLVTSGYRSRAVNLRVGGAPTSAHLYGRAADFHCPGHTTREIVEWVVGSGLPYDQVIDEQTWVHVGIAANNTAPRKEALTYTNRTYVPFA
jgi:zinc D-Ala-D-Ala carboxypeptidase